MTAAVGGAVGKALVLKTAGAVGAAFFVGTTQIGEKLSSAATPQQAMLDGIHLAMGSALLLGGLMVFFATKLHANSAA